LAERRRAAPEWPGAATAPGMAANPQAIDPFAMFANYPSDTLTAGHRVVLAEGGAAAVPALLTRQLSNYCAGDLPTPAEAAAMAGRLAKGGASVEELVKLFPAERRAVAERAVVWLTKHGAVRIAKPG
jgi:hypothetical protein